MARFIFFALCALVGFSQAAPIENNGVSSPMNHAVGNMLSHDIVNFVAEQDKLNLVKRHWEQDEEEESYDEESDDNEDDGEDDGEDSGEDSGEDDDKTEGGNEGGAFNLEDIFRGIFDNIVDHIIEVTPLNDIVHGNYDLLYDIFTAKLQEILSGAAADAQQPSADTTKAVVSPSENIKVDVTKADEKKESAEASSEVKE